MSKIQMAIAEICNCNEKADNVEEMFAGAVNRSVSDPEFYEDFFEAIHVAEKKLKEAGLTKIESFDSENYYKVYLTGYSDHGTFLVCYMECFD